MDSALIDRWLGDAERIPVLDEASVSLVRERARAEARALGLPIAVEGAVVNVASELAFNQLAHARGGEVAIVRLARGGVPGLEVVAADDGPGLRDPAAALEGASAHAERPGGASLGIGLAAARELADEMDFDVRLGQGTCVRARKFASPVPRRREVGVYGRPYPGEAVSGDDCAFARDDDALFLALADGLGHGPEALEASSLAVRIAVAARAEEPPAVLRRCHDGLARTRGAVMAVVAVPEATADARLGIVGNVSARAAGTRGARRYEGPSFVLGAPGRAPRVLAERLPLDAHDVLALYSDGLTSRTELAEDPDLLRQPAIVVAQRLVERFARDNDDVLVAVVR